MTITLHDHYGWPIGRTTIGRPRWERTALTPATQIQPGVYRTGIWQRRNGQVIQRTYSTWDTGTGKCFGERFSLLSPVDAAATMKWIVGR